MAIRYDEPGVRYDDASYSYDGHYRGDPLRMDACYLANRQATQITGGVVL